MGLVGRCVLSLMNIGHAPHSAWGRAHLSPARDAHILDIGCGGGANLAHFLRMCPEGLVCGIDFSTVSVAHSLRKNADAVAAGRCEINIIREIDLARAASYCASRSRRCCWSVVAVAVPASTACLRSVRDYEIGRASCRERV